MKLKTKLALIFLIALFALIGQALFNYQKEKSKSTSFIIINWRMTPSYITDTNHPITFSFHLKDKQNKPITNALVTIELKNAEVPPQIFPAPHDQFGFYKARVKLTKLGNWTLTAKIQRVDGTLIQREFSFSTNQ